MNRDQPAFPVPADANATGLTKRECAAIVALEGLCANAGMHAESCNVESVAARAAELADALFAHLDA